MAGVRCPHVEVEAVLTQLLVGVPTSRCPQSQGTECPHTGSRAPLEGCGIWHLARAAWAPVAESDGGPQVALRRGCPEKQRQGPWEPLGGGLARPPRTITSSSGPPGPRPLPPPRRKRRRRSWEARRRVQGGHHEGLMAARAGRRLLGERRQKLKAQGCQGREKLIR